MTRLAWAKNAITRQQRQAQTFSPSFITKLKEDLARPMGPFFALPLNKNNNNSKNEEN